MNHPDTKLNEYCYNRYKGNYTKLPVDKKEASYLPISSANLYPSHSKDPLDNFFQAKRVNLARSVEDITGLIEQREKIKERNHIQFYQDYHKDITVSYYEYYYTVSLERLVPDLCQIEVKTSKNIHNQIKPNKNWNFLEINELYCNLMCL